jgi:hypothetical protein
MQVVIYRNQIVYSWWGNIIVVVNTGKLMLVTQEFFIGIVSSRKPAVL